jgi:hypothetical protein
MLAPPRACPTHITNLHLLVSCLLPDTDYTTPLTTAIPKMQSRLVITLLLGFVALTVARALPFNASTGGVGDYKPSIEDYIIQTAGYYQPNNIASDAIWDKYQKKGDHYQCLFPASNEAAGRLVEDKRTPPSAQSVWSGDMYGK